MPGMGTVYPTLSLAITVTRAPRTPPRRAWPTRGAAAGFRRSEVAESDLRLPRSDVLFGLLAVI
jgi:hypothetical protein